MNQGIEKQLPNHSYAFKQPTFARRLEYEEDGEFTDSRLQNAIIYIGLTLMVLTDTLSRPEEVLSFIKGVCRNPRVSISNFQRWMRQPDFQEHLYMQQYGHEDVIDLFKGRRSKVGNDSSTLTRKLCIIALGGGQSGNIGAGVLRGMQEMGAYQRADGIVMVSAGIPNVMYTEAEQNPQGVKIYQDDNTQEGFFLKLPKGKKDAAYKLIQLFKKGPEDPIVDTTTVAEGMRNRRPLDVEKIRSSTRELIAVVMNSTTGEPSYIDLRHTSDPIKVEDAGICIPAISSVAGIELDDGQMYVDAGSADPIPIKWAFDHGYTDVFIAANSPIIRGGGLLVNTFQSLILERLAKNPNYHYGEPAIKALKKYPYTIARAAADVNQIIRENNPSRRVAVIEPCDNSMSGLLDLNRERMIVAYNDAVDFARTTFSRYL